MCNLITSPLLPVRRRSGRRQHVAPHQILDGSDDPITCLDAPRADIEGALFQFLVGLLQTALAPLNEAAWTTVLESPPTAADLQLAFGEVSKSFNLLGGGPRFMQDLDPYLTGAEIGIGNLFLDAPGKKTIEDNKDFFVRRGRIEGLCPGCAAMALLTLQTNAPSGGAGHRTSLRGGGPLTTVLVSENPAQATLFRDLWLNVLPATESLGVEGQAGCFPWTEPTRISQEDGTVTHPGVAHALTAYWGTPRRIRLVDPGSLQGTCDLCGEDTSTLITRYQTRPWGANYIGWTHPLSPYYRVKPEEDLLPVHPNPGGLTYRHWLDMVFPREGLREPAKIVTHARSFRSSHRPALWAFGYDMDNMKARSWQDVRFPFFPNVAAEMVEPLVRAAALAKDYLLRSVKQAWNRDPKSARGDYGFAESQFWDVTEARFFGLVASLDQPLEAGRTFEEAQHEALSQWAQTLRQAAIATFDGIASRGDVAFEQTERWAEARLNLVTRLGAAMAKELGLATAQTPVKEPA